MEERKTTQKKVIAIISAVILIGVAFIFIGYQDIAKKPTLIIGPKIKINTFINPLNNSTNSFTNNITETVQIFSPMPKIFGKSFSTNITSYNLTGLNPYNNSIYI